MSVGHLDGDGLEWVEGAVPLDFITGPSTNDRSCRLHGSSPR